MSGNREFKEHPTYKKDVHDKFYAFAKGCYSKLLTIIISHEVLMTRKLVKIA